jgi:hypothetical protein
MTWDLDSPAFVNEIKRTITVKIESNLPVSVEVFSQDPSALNSNQLHVEIFQFFFIYFKYILQIPPKW